MEDSNTVSRKDFIQPVAALLLTIPGSYLINKAGLKELGGDGIVQSVIFLIALAIATRPVRCRPAEDDLRDIGSSQSTLPPAAGVIEFMAAILAIESFFGAALGAVAGATIAALDGKVDLTSPEYQEIVARAISPPIEILMFLFAIPVASFVSHRLPRRFVLLWLLVAIILARLLRLAILLVAFKHIFSLGELVIGSLQIVVILWISAFIGFLFSRRRRDKYLLAQAFSKLDEGDRRAVLELMLDRRAGD